MKRGRITPMIDGDEYDFLTWCKKFFTFRAGERKQYKRRYNKRDRRRGKWLTHLDYESMIDSEVDDE